MKKFLLLSLLLFTICACATDGSVEKEKKSGVLNPVTDIVIKADRKGNVLTVDVSMNSKSKVFSAEMDDTGKNVTLRTGNIGLYRLEYETARPLVSVEPVLAENNDYMIKMKLALRCEMSKTDTENGFRLIFRQLEPDTELMAMQAFGSWIRPYTAATRLSGVKNEKSYTVLSFDGIPVYSKGNNGQSNFVDIYDVRIPAGNIKYDGVVSTALLDGKSRIVFKGDANICIKDRKMTLGRSCAGYMSLFGLSKEKKNGNEKFMFRLTGRPEITVKTLKGVTGLGMKNVRLFSAGLVRFEGDAVFKTEVRESGGLTWIVFVHDPAYKFRRFYSSGDVLNVVFYKG